MKTKRTLTFLAVLLLLTTLINLSVVPNMVDAANTNYVSNRSPLVSTPFVGLPLGTVKANGWLLKQLELQRDGLTGHAEEIYSELASNSAWLGGNAANSDWERPAYYARGLVDLAYTLNDTNLKTKAQKWMDWAINSQQASGYFGPATNTDWWAHMPMLCAIRDYYEATNDSRVLNFFTKYYQYQNNNTPTDIGYWGKARVADNIDSVFWLYNRTGDSFLMTLADKMRNLSLDWSTGFNTNSLPDTHGVNVAEGYKFPAVWWQKSNSSNDRTGYANGHNNIMIGHGMPHQVYSCTEALAGRSSTQGTEQCTMVERIWSDGISVRNFGDAAIGDNMEKVAFNALPGSLSKSSRQQQYYTVMNQAQSKYSSKGYAQDYANGILPSSLSGYPCCCFNWHMGWPRFTMYSWTATDDNGLAIMAYAPTEVNAKVASGVSVKFVEDTNYPFEQQIRLTFTSSQSVQFPLKLRIPA